MPRAVKHCLQDHRRCVRGLSSWRCSWGPGGFTVPWRDRKRPSALLSSCLHLWSEFHEVNPASWLDPFAENVTQKQEATDCHLLLKPAPVCTQVPHRRLFPNPLGESSTCRTSLGLALQGRVDSSRCLRLFKVHVKSRWLQPHFKHINGLLFNAGRDLQDVHFGACGVGGDSDEINKYYLETVKAEQGIVRKRENDHVEYNLRNAAELSCAAVERTSPSPLSKQNVNPISYTMSLCFEMAQISF